MTDPSVIFGQWEAFLGWLLERTAKFPRAVRHTLTIRIENTALDVFEALVDARYTRERTPILRRANLKLRLMLRLAHARQFLDPRAFSHACKEIDHAGRMVGGWLRVAGRPDDGTA